MHSAWYRTPTVFRNKRVLIVGNFSSGTDIAREICGGSVRNFAGGDQWQRDVEAGATNTKVFQSYLRLDLPPLWTMILVMLRVLIGVVVSKLWGKLIMWLKMARCS